MNADIRPENRFLALAWGGRNLFLTGMAGTGKSTLLREFIAGCEEPLLHSSGLWPDGTWKPSPPAEGRSVDVTAPTGIAALNVNGMTVHRFAGMLLGPAKDQSNEDYYDWLVRQPYRSLPNGWERVRNCGCLVIDEISMLPGRQLDFLEWLFRRLRRSEDPWGGCQVIVVGDFLQLAPVRKSEKDPYDWAFDSLAWEVSGFTTIELTKVHRQDNADFIAALAGVRTGRVVGDAARILGGCVRNFPPDDMPRLYTHNVMVDRRNESALDELDGELFTFEAEVSGNEQQIAWLEKNLICPRTLRLKVGARVMTTRNHPTGDFVNGSIGTVVELSHGGLVAVMLDVGRRVLVEPYEWTVGEDGSQGSFTQFPMRLAYAMTIHKSQGITLDRAYVDIRAAREPGQAYVALSRVRTLEGLWLKDWFTGLFVSERAIDFQTNPEMPRYATRRVSTDDSTAGPTGETRPVRERGESPYCSVLGEAGQPLLL